MLHFACAAFLPIEHQSTHILPVRNVKLYVQMYQVCYQFHSPLGGSLQKLLLQCEWVSLQACHMAIVLRTFFDYHSGIRFLFPGPHTILFLGLPPSIWWRTSSSIFQRTYSWELNFLKVCLKMSENVSIPLLHPDHGMAGFPIRNDFTIEFWRLNFLVSLPCCYWEIGCHCDILSLVCDVCSKAFRLSSLFLLVWSFRMGAA